MSDQKTIQENFFYEDCFCGDIEDLMSELNLEEEHLPDLPDDWTVKVMGTKLEPMFQLSNAFIVSEVFERSAQQWEERFPENSERVDKELKQAIEAGIDVEKINSLIPSIYYPDDSEYTITKADLIEWCKPAKPSYTIDHHS